MNDREVEVDTEEATGGPATQDAGNVARMERGGGWCAWSVGSPRRRRCEGLLSATMHVARLVAPMAERETLGFTS